MARKLRLEYAGACYHLINRGNYRRDLFQGKGAADSFIACVLEAAERFGWRLHAYVVMRNHFHLAVETPEPNLSDGMQWLQGTWARRRNACRWTHPPASVNTCGDSVLARRRGSIARIQRGFVKNQAMTPLEHVLQANFYNVNDYALSAPVWQTDQTLKPDKVVGYSTGTSPNRIGPPYGYAGDPATAPVKTGFFKTTYGPDANGNEVKTGTTSLSLEDVDPNNGSVTNLRDRYEIMAFASQPRSKALGGVTTVAGFSPQNLGSLWPDDTTEPDRQNWYRSHPWHSAQFRFTNAEQANYWNKFMKKLGLPTTQ